MSFSASIIGVIQLAGSVISTCYEYVNGVKNAPKDIRSIITELRGLSDVLDRLCQLAESSSITTLEQLSGPDGSLEMCKKELGDLQEKLKLPEGWKAKRKALFWPMKEGDVRKTLANLERTKSMLTLALTLHNTYVSIDVIKDRGYIDCVYRESIELVRLGAFRLPSELVKRS
jgi:hypothetical protein